MIVDVIVEKLVGSVWYYRHMSQLKKGDTFRTWYLKEDKWKRHVDNEDGSTEWEAASDPYINVEHILYPHTWTIDIIVKI
jgi:hypothetical protein